MLRDVQVMPRPTCRLHLQETWFLGSFPTLAATVWSSSDHGQVDAEQTFVACVYSQPLPRLGCRLMNRRSWRAAALAILMFTAAAPASGHPVPFSYLDLRVEGATIDGTLVAHIFNVGHDLGIEPPERPLTPP